MFQVIQENDYSIIYIFISDYDSYLYSGSK